MYLYFEHSSGSLSFVGECSKENVGQKILDHIHSLNPNYKTYYIRSWGDDKQGYTYDVGSHTEFYHLYKERHTEV